MIGRRIGRGATAPLPQHRPRGDGMDKTSNLPLALWQANLDLQMRLGQLLQDGDGQARKLLQAGDWPALAALPMETFWRQAGQAGDGKAAAQTALQAQQEFVGGLAEALQDWQRQSAKAWSAASIDAGAVPGIDGSWQAMQSNLEQAIAAM